ncbi:hypothetical protein E2C01_040118 [Portunus trituberculatus]|uniref:Uncharacterized protein n=1 Tax=Portunus trituberculatus TaxID=210409 RepID=A0A5B7FM40_PORTR|nr:hypothetical protein [Portunus trituberculatus]
MRKMETCLCPRAGPPQPPSSPTLPLLSLTRSCMMGEYNSVPLLVMTAGARREERGRTGDKADGKGEGGMPECRGEGTRRRRRNRGWKASRWPPPI